MRLSVLIIFLSLFTLGACGTQQNRSTSRTGDESPCFETLTNKDDIQMEIQDFDVSPLPDAAIDALQAGCAASEADIETFVEAFLCAIEAATTFQSDLDIQNDIDNLESVDLSDLPGSCDEINAL